MKEENVIKYYVVCSKLKDIIRTGWLNWNVKRERLESVAEHIFGVQMLAIAMKSEYNYDIDIMKVIYMLAIHELGEAVIGDITQFEITKENKKKIEHEAVHKILNGLLDGDFIEQLFLEFDDGKNPEAKFAYQCDKLECDLQAKKYDEENCVDLNDQENNPTFYDSKVQELFNQGYTWSGMWLKFGQDRYPYDENFRAVSNYAMTHKISETNKLMDKSYIDSYKKDVINEVNEELESIGPSLITKIKELKVDDLILNETANELLDLYHDDGKNLKYIVDQIHLGNYKELSMKMTNDFLVYKVVYEGDLMRDGYEKAYLYMFPGASIKLHTHINDAEEYTLMQGTLNVNGVECTTNRCLLGESHCVNSSNKPIIIKTIKISRELIEKEYNESLLKRNIRAKKLTFKKDEKDENK